MPKVKNQRERLKIIEKCIIDINKKYDRTDLIIELRDSGFDVSQRTLDGDLALMRKEAKENGGKIKLIKCGVLDKNYYRYSDLNFSIYSEFSPNEKKQLQASVNLLRRFGGLPNHEWISDISDKINIALNLNPNNQKVVFFQSNPNLEGVKDFFSDLFNSILNKQVLTIFYKSFKNNQSQNLTIHPYILKEYNERWFLFGHCNESGMLYNLAIDRIIDYNENIDIIYKETNINFEEYFDNIIGVTTIKKNKIKKIVLKFSEHRFPYVKTKPIHSSQRIINDRTIELNLKINNEFIAKLLSYGLDLKVISPSSLRNDLINIYKKALKMNT